VKKERRRTRKGAAPPMHCPPSNQPQVPWVQVSAPPSAPLPQVEPGQQISPAPPQRWQVWGLAELQANPSPQVLLRQQGCPSPPQARQGPLTAARVKGAVQVPLQSGWPRPPQVPQLPAWQVPLPPPQLLAAPTHWPKTQQPPLSQALSAQQS
jgi:hypothetical protein